MAWLGVHRPRAKTGQTSSNTEEKLDLYRSSFYFGLKLCDRGYGKAPTSQAQQPSTIAQPRNWGGPVSRGYRARQKAKRQQARATAAKPVRRRGQPRPRRLVALVPIFAIAAILAAVAALGFGAGSGVSQEQVDREVTALLANIPQSGPVLGSPTAPITIQIFADLECPTVKRFVVAYLPSIVRNWVRNGAINLEYRSLETDTGDERMFFQQEVAALAAGRQNKMWNFILTFVHEQRKASTHYATDTFLREITSQVPGLNQAQWRHDREGAVLSEHIALDVQSANAKGFRFTPSFVISSKRGHVGENDHTTYVERHVRSFLSKAVGALGKEASEQAFKDVPSLRFANPSENN